jgi:hypothetical protein
MRAPRTSPGLLALLVVLWIGAAPATRALSLALCDIGVAFPEESRAALDANGDGLWGFPTDLEKTVAVFAGPGQILVGDWNGDGADELAKLVLVPSVGIPAVRPFFYVDFNGSGAWEGTAGGDRWANWVGSSSGLGDPVEFVPLTWRVSDRDVVAYYAPQSQRFVVDLNQNVVWNGNAGGDVSFPFAVFAGPGVPVLGNWDGAGGDAAGVFFPDTSRFLLDANRNWQWDGSAGGDRNHVFAASFGPGLVPVTGDWNGDGRDQIGVFRAPGTFLLDANGNGVWDGKAVDVRIDFGGMDPASRPLVCDWNGDGADDVGVASSDGVFRIDLDGDKVFGPVDRELPFTPSGQGPAQPIAGVWSQP